MRDLYLVFSRGCGNDTRVPVDVDGRVWRDYESGKQQGAKFGFKSQWKAAVAAERCVSRAVVVRRYSDGAMFDLSYHNGF